MKKKISILLLLLFMFCPTILVACSPNNSGDGGKSNNSSINSINISYMKDLTIDVNNSKAFGIKKVLSSNNPSELINYSNVSLLNAPLISDDSKLEEKYYLYSTTETYENGNVEYDNNSITKVSFKKNTSVEEDVYDSNGNLIDSNRTITQEEIPAQINKLYVNKKYMFMQFVALVDKSGNYNYSEDNEIKSEYLELRPEELTYNEDGVSDFDLKNYYSSALTQSFVVDITNGNIYKISNFNIASIHDIDIVKDNFGNYFKMTINAQRELVFIDIMPNKDIEVKGVRTDKYGYTFVINDNSINEKDIENKIIYTSNTLHMISEDATIYTLTKNGNVQDLYQQYINGELQDIDTNSKIYGLQIIYETLSFQSPIFYYKGYNLHGFYPANNYTDLDGKIKFNYNSSSMQKYPCWFVGNSNYIYFISNNQIYYKNIILEDYFTNETTLNLSDFSLVSDKKLYPCQYYMNVGKDKIAIKNVFYETTLNGTNYYQLCENNNNLELRLLQNKEYEQTIFIFQPINK